MAAYCFRAGCDWNLVASRCAALAWRNSYGIMQKCSSNQNVLYFRFFPGRSFLFFLRWRLFTHQSFWQSDSGRSWPETVSQQSLRSPRGCWELVGCSAFAPLSNSSKTFSVGFRSGEDKNEGRPPSGGASLTVLFFCISDIYISVYLCVGLAYALNMSKTVSVHSRWTMKWCLGTILDIQFLICFHLLFFRFQRVSRLARYLKGLSSLVFGCGSYGNQWWTDHILELMQTRTR